MDPKKALRNWDAYDVCPECAECRGLCPQCRAESNGKEQVDYVAVAIVILFTLVGLYHVLTTLLKEWML